ncbi:hypothetical protein ACVXG7_25845 [Enterobacter hormaechei]
MRIADNQIFRRTEQAASSLRETASAVEEITASVTQSNESAAEAMNR